MAALSNKLENAFIDWFFRGQAIGLGGASAAAGTGPTSLYLALYTTAPTAAGGGTEVSGTGTGYARVAVSSALANWAATQGGTTASTGTTGATSNVAAITFPAPSTTAWGTIVAFGILDSATLGSGNLLLFGNLSTSKTVNALDAAPAFAAAALSLTFS